MTWALLYQGDETKPHQPLLLPPLFLQSAATALLHSSGSPLPPPLPPLISFTRLKWPGDQDPTKHSTASAKERSDRRRPAPNSGKKPLPPSANRLFTRRREGC